MLGNHELTVTIGVKITAKMRAILAGSFLQFSDTNHQRQRIEARRITSTEITMKRINI
jgi:hypothetical protein